MRKTRKRERYENKIIAFYLHLKSTNKYDIKLGEIRGKTNVLGCDWQATWFNQSLMMKIPCLGYHITYEDSFWNWIILVNMAPGNSLSSRNGSVLYEQWFGLPRETILILWQGSYLPSHYDPPLLINDNLLFLHLPS